MDGILIIDKPAGITSHDVVARVRRILRTKRVGHTGTLDPFATGVMVVLIGRATRLAQFLDKDKKEYVAGVSFGYETDTGDLTGTPRDSEQTAAGQEIERDDIEPVLDRFRGEIKQVPPMYSAKKVDGKKLYELARKGEEIERKAVDATISELEVLSGDGAEWTIRVVCSAGTYIRTLAEDIGRAVGVGAHLSSLRRTAAGRFTIGEAVDLDTLNSSDRPEQYLQPVETAVAHLARFDLTDERSQRTRNGMSSRVYDAQYSDKEMIRMTDARGQIVAIGVFDAVENAVRPKVVLV